MLTSQGRTKTVTYLSMGVFLPLSLGSIALMVLVLRRSLPEVYWVIAAVSCVEAALVWGIIRRSDWSRASAEAVARLEPAGIELLPAGVSPALSTARSVRSKTSVDE